MMAAPTRTAPRYKGEGDGWSGAVAHFLESGMTDLLSDYREWRAAQEQRIGTHSDRCHMYHERCMIHRLAREVERLRAALEVASGTTQETAADPHRTSKTL